MGPIEYVEFAYDDREVRENYARVVFKHPCSVEDSIRLFRGTKLYGLPIVTKMMSNDVEDPVFHDQLNYFKQLVDVERNTQSNYSNRNRWIDHSSDIKSYIPDCLPEPPMHHVQNINSNKDNYEHKSDNMSRNSYKDKSSKYQQSTYTKNRNSMYGSEHNPTDKSQYSRGHYRKSEHSSSGSMEVSNNDRDSHHFQNYDRKYQGFGHTSSNWEESTYHNQESFMSGNNSVKNTFPVRDLRDTMYRKRSLLDSNYYNDTNSNAACTSLLDLRDTMYHNKSSRYEDLGHQNKSNSNNRWSERNKMNDSNDIQFHKNNYTSEQRYNESNIKHENNYGNRDYYDRSFNEDSLHEYNDSYGREKNRSNNDKYSQMCPQSMESNHRQHNSYHPYKRNGDGYGKKEYKNAYNERSGHGRGKNFNREGTDRSRQHYYS